MDKLKPVQQDPTVPTEPFLTEHEANRLRKITIELARRKIEGLRLYRPLPMMQRFHDSLAKECVIRGSNRSGKTLAAAVQVARCVTGQDPLGRVPPNDGIWYCVGKDGREVGQVMWRKLGRPGAFRMIRDKVTGEWRVYQPNDPEDAARAADARPAPPLIPKRMIASIAWENKKENQPKMVKLTNGWELHFFSSMGKPPHGSAIHGAWFDEEIFDKDWYPEIAARLVDESGYFIWSATPQAGTEQLFSLHEEAEKEQQAGTRHPRVAEFKALMVDNDYQTPAQRAEFAAKLTEDEYAVRVEGEFALLAFKVFPEYQREIHDVDYFQVPNDWTRCLAIDPGRQICAVLFMAIPPPDHGDFAYLYDELYIPQCNAEIFGAKMAQKCQGQQFEAFVIDHQEGRKVEAGGGRSIEDMYSEALQKRNVQCAQTGSHFHWGDNNPKAGVEAIRLWLRFRDEQPPKLRVMCEKLQKFIWELKHYRYKRTAGHEDSPEDRGRVHLMACLRYLVQFDPKYIEPKKGKVKNPVVEALRKKREAKKSKNPSMWLGPGVGV